MFAASSSLRTTYSLLPTCFRLLYLLDSHIINPDRPGNESVELVGLISPYRQTRAYARAELQRFIEVYVKASVDECIKRDPKGLYKKALAGEITNMTGIQDPYEEPLNPELVLNTEHDSTEKNVAQLIQKLEDLKYIKH